MAMQCTLRHFCVIFPINKTEKNNNIDLVIGQLSPGYRCPEHSLAYLFCTCWSGVIPGLMGSSSGSVLQSVLCSWDHANYLTITIITLFVSLKGRKWIKTSRDEVCLSLVAVVAGETYFPSLPASNIFPHTGVVVKWTGSPGPRSQYISLCSVGGREENSQVITDCLSPLSSLGKISNFVIIIFGTGLAPLYQTHHSHSLGKLKQRRPWWYFPSYAPVWNIMEQSHYLHLVYLVLLPHHIYYIRPTSQCEDTKCEVPLRVWGKDYNSLDEACQQSTEMSSNSFYSVPAVPQNLNWTEKICYRLYKLYWIRISFNFLFHFHLTCCQPGLKSCQGGCWLVSGHFVCQFTDHWSYTSYAC